MVTAGDKVREWKQYGIYSGLHVLANTNEIKCVILNVTFFYTQIPPELQRSI